MIHDCTKSYRLLSQDAGQVLVPRRVALRVTGKDHCRVLHNFCTNDIRNLKPGSGTEAFVLDVKGKTINHAFFFANEDSIDIDAASMTEDKGVSILEHIDNYVVSEKVFFEDRSESISTIFVAGPNASERASQALGATLPIHLNSHIHLPNYGDVRLVDTYGPRGYALVHDSAQSEALQSLLVEHSIAVCEPEALEILRIEYGMPRFGVDISSKNLPQEICRNPHAISFEKGCYLGQETVARIDSLGHVNRLLVGIQFDTDSLPPVGYELKNDGKVVGVITSATGSIHLKKPLAIGFIRRGLHTAGTQIETEFGSAHVIELPVV